MKNNLISTRWFPAYGFCAGKSSLVDNVFDDFDRQSEQLLGHDQSYLQLSPGAFRGRFMSAFLGEDVAIHMEFCNQALEQEVRGSSEYFSFGVTLSNTDHFFVRGRQFAGDDLFVLPPSGELHLISPKGGAVMAIAIHRDLLLRQPYMTPKSLDWLDSLGSNVGFLRAGKFARRLREDAVAAIESVAQVTTSMPGAIIGQALAASIASKLALEWGSLARRDEYAGSPSYERFQTCRHWLLSGDGQPNSSIEFADMVCASKRSVEKAFSENVSMGPLTYLRILRLHDIKRKLMNPAMVDQSIGDIAAEHGFWDWSRFSQHYRRHFGELPSTTRQNNSHQR